MYTYYKIAEAIEYIKTNFRSQPSLEDIAAHVHLSPFHFQRLFRQWAGVSPKSFLQYITLAHAKAMLQDRQASLFDAALDSGLSGTGRLHDLFIKIEGMTPGEYKNGGEGLVIDYHFNETPFGQVLVASTPRGVCWLAFTDEKQKGLDALRHRFPSAALRQARTDHQWAALQIFSKDWDNLPEIKLHLKGTPFQLKVWEALLHIPSGELTTYGGLAEKIGSARAARAVGSAVGDNPVAFLIPCHRVVRASGEFGEYMWGSLRKTAILGWEAAQVYGEIKAGD